MNRLRLDPSEKRPSEAAIANMWTELQVVSAPVENNHFQHVIAALSSCYVNGGAKFVRFSIDTHPVLNWFAARQNLRAIDFIPKFLSNPPVVDILAAEGLGSPKLTDSVIDESSAFTLDGELAKVLKDGGAYPNLYKCTDQEAKNLGNAFCAELFADRFGDINV